YLPDQQQEHERGVRRPARQFAIGHPAQPILVTEISVRELAEIFESAREARDFLNARRVLRLTPEIAYAAAAVDRELIATGERLGENDNWIAGFCRYYGQALISRDVAFDRVNGLRRV